MSIFKSTVIKGNKLTEFAQTQATVGITIPFGKGRYPVDGNVGWAPLPPKTNRTVKRQGKGGVKQEEFSYTMPYLIFFGKGPVYGFWWIKRNGKVVYTQDPAAPIEDQAYAAKWLQKVNFLYGTDSQMPDSTIESYKGTGMVSAFRGMCGFVHEEDDVTEGAGAVPSYEAVPMATPPEVYFTSKPYAQHFIENVTTSPRMASVLLEDLLKEAYTEDAERDTIVLSGGVLAESLGATIEDWETNHITLTGGVLQEPPIGNIPDNEQDHIALTDGVLAAVPTGYPQDDNETDHIALTGGELKVP